MARRRADPKIETLRERGCLNPHPERVTDPRFAETDFFDARDLVQVKYEMVRAATVEENSVTAAAAGFGFSRPSFYAARAALEVGGIEALVPARPGPRRAHKLSDEVVDFLEASLGRDPSLGSGDLAVAVHGRFGISVHPRSVERALSRREKKRR